MIATKSPRLFPGIQNHRTTSFTAWENSCGSSTLPSIVQWTTGSPQDDCFLSKRHFPLNINEA